MKIELKQYYLIRKYVDKQPLFSIEDLRIHLKLKTGNHYSETSVTKALGTLFNIRSELIKRSS